MVGMSLLSLGFAMIIDRGKMRTMMWCGMIATWLATVGWLAMIWSQFSENQIIAWLWWSVMLNGAAISILLVGIVAQLRLSQQWGIVLRRVTIGLLMFLGFIGSATICFAIEAEFFWRVHRRMDASVVDWSETAARLCGVIAILTGCSLAATILAAVVPKLHEQEVPKSRRLQFTAVCPRCALRQQLMTDGDACHQCGLQIKVVPT